jgi:hypothetical protein
MKVKTLIIVVVAVVFAIAMGASWGSHVQKSGASWGSHAQAASWTDRAAKTNASWGS